jgi:hypothetical protein
LPGVIALRTHRDDTRYRADLDLQGQLTWTFGADLDLQGQLTWTFRADLDLQGQLTWAFGANWPVASGSI